MSTRDTKHLWPEFLVVVAVVAVFAEALFTRASIFARDMGAYMLPAREWWYERVSRGEFPEWLPNIAIGIPYIADPNHQAFYPPQLLQFLLLPHAFDVSLIGHVAFAGLGAVRLARRLDADATGAALGGLAFGLGGYVVSMVPSGFYLCGVAYVPWVVLAMLGVGRERFDSRGVARLALVVALELLAGDFQTALYANALGLLVAFLVEPGSDSRASRLAGAVRRLVGIALALAVGCLLASPQLIPAALFAANSERQGGVSVDEAQIFSTHPLRLLDIVVPRAWGDPFAGPYYGASLEHGPFVVPWSFSLYSGVALLILLPLGLRRAAPAMRRTLWVLAALYALALLVALGVHTPVYALIHRYVPFFGFFRYPEKAFAAGSLLAAMLVALSASVAFEATPTGERKLGPAVVGPALLVAFTGACWFLSEPLARALVGAGLAPAAAPDAMSNLRQQGLLASGLATLAFVGITARSRWLLVAVAFVDLALVAVRVQTPADVSAAVLAPELQVRMARARAEGRPFRLYDQRGFFEGSLPDTFERVYRITAKPNRGLVDGVHHLRPYMAAGPRTGGLLLGLLDAQPERLARIGSAMNVVTDGARHRAGMFPDATVAASWGPLVLLDLPAPLPHAYVLGAAVTAADEASAAALVVSPAFPLDRVAVFIGSAPSSVPRLRDLADAPPPIPCTLSRYAPEDVAFTCTLDRPGVAVLADQVLDGWELEVDGAPAPIERVQLAYRGAVLPPGAHTLVYRYHTPGLLAGVAASALGLVLFAWLWWRPRALFSDRSATTSP